MRRLFGLLLAVVTASFVMSGCANRAIAKVDPSAQLDKLQRLEVKTLQGEDGTIRMLIADDLRARGYSVGPEGKTPPEKIDAVVTYVDRWMWDITMYLLELTVTIRDPQTEKILATGNSMHTSLTRKSPPEMVDEVMGNIFKGSAKKQ